MTNAALGFTLLGTGSPKPNLARSQPATVIHCNNEALLVDCGECTTNQLLKVGISPRDVNKVFLTHLHWDHILGYPGLIWGGWALGRSALELWGPEGTSKMHRNLVTVFYEEQARFAEALGYPLGGWDSVTVNDIKPSTLHPLDGLSITVSHVYHPPMEAFGYRFDYRGRSLVLSGDTGYCEELIELAKGADVLVVDACAYTSSPSPQAATLVKKLNTFHASPQEAAHMAKAADVGHMVLTHLLADVDEREIKALCSSIFSGRISVGKDLRYYDV